MRSFAALLASLGLLCACAPSAPAATVTIGSPLKADFQPSTCTSDCTLVFSSLQDPAARATSPVSGAIVRWRLLLGEPEEPYQLRVATPGAGGSFTSTAVSPVVVPAGEGLETFPVNIPIAAGQTIGIDLKAAASLGNIEDAAVTSTYGYFSPGHPQLGAPAGFDVTDGEFAVNADVQPVPAISAVAPARGSIAGARLTISGTDFSGVGAVSVGGQPATFAVVSESQITATAPKVKQPGPVAVTVTTIAGTSPPAAFTYTACVVPKLTGRKLKADRRKLRRSGCALGSVRGEKGKTAKVVKQFRKPGTILPAGAKVGVKVEERAPGRAVR